MENETELIELMVVDGMMEAEIIKSKLENFEIPCRRFLPNSLDVSINNKTVNILLVFCCRTDFFFIVIYSF